MADINICSISDVVVVQVPNKAVANPSIAEIKEASTARCIASAFSPGLDTETAPAIISMMPKNAGNKAVR